MGDRTYQQATVWQCSEELARAAAEVLAEYRNADIDTTTTLGIGTVYYMEEGSLGTAEETAKALVELGAAIVAETWQDPKYEYLGSHYLVLGGDVTSMPCDSDGDDLVFAHDLDHICARDENTMAERLAWIEQIAQSVRRAALREAKGTGECRTILLPVEAA